MAAALMDPITTISGEGGSKFQVVVEKRQQQFDDDGQFEVFTEEKDAEEITPSYYYENMGIPVFEPTMDQFRSFKHFVDKINHYGMQSGIVKVIPPKEWTDSLATLEDKLKDIRIKNPIIQHMAGVAGEYRQENIEKQRTYNLPQWRQLCESSEHQPPAKRGERRKGQIAKEAPVGRKTRSRKSAVVAVVKEEKGAIAAVVKKENDVVTAVVKKEKDDVVAVDRAEGDGTVAGARKRNPPTPKSPEKAKQDENGTPGPITDSHGRQPRISRGIESTPDPITDSHGRQPRQKKKYVRKTAKEREAEQAIAEDEAFDGFDFRIQNADDYTPERCDELEKAYWRTLTYSDPLYGADMPGSLFDDSTTSWNVAKLENLLDCLGKKLPGVNTAYLYLGMWRSTFAWHLEDVDLYSINYIHFGAPKQWYSISREDKPKFEQVMRGIWPNDSKKCSQFLRHKNYLVSPSLLLSHGIKVNKLVHHQGEFVITFPFGYHSGYNLGYNCAESVNFATESWLEYGRNAKKCECIKDSVWVDVEEIERKLRGESTEDEDDGIEYYYYEDEDEDDLEANDLPTPPESVEGKPVKPKSHKKRKFEDGKERPAKVKRLRLKFNKEPAPEPCILCPNNIPYEELVATDDGQKAHRLCAIYTPETYFKWDEAQQQEVVANTPGIPKARLELRCIFCRSTKGACFQCSAKKCSRAYHATCAAAAGVLVNMFDVPQYGEDGRIYPQTDIDFRCRFHRPKRAKDLDGEKLENDMVIRKFANSLLKGDVIQMQYYRSDIFAGVVIENRYSEESVVVNVLPKGTESLEVEWKWILAQDPSTVPLPPPLTEMPLYPTAQQSGVITTKAPKLFPEPDDPFCDEGSGLKWGEFVIENPFLSEDQVPVDPNNPIWHYLGEFSTEYISKYTEDPKKRVPNEAASIGSTRKPRAKTIRIPAKPPKPVYYGPSPTQHPQYSQSPYTSVLTQHYHSPVPHTVMGEDHMSLPPQQQLWPPVYQATVSAGNNIASIVADATKAFINEHALSPPQEHVTLDHMSPEHISLTNSGARQQSNGLSNHDASNSMIDPQLMAQGALIASLQQAETCDTIVVTQLTPAQPTSSSSPPSSPSFSPSSSQATPATEPAQNATPMPANKTGDPEQASASATLGTPQGSSAISASQYSPSAPQQTPNTTPRKHIPLADIQAALAQLARAKAQEQKAKADVEKAKANVEAARAQERRRQR